MIDLRSSPDHVLAQAFLLCGWRLPRHPGALPLQADFVVASSEVPPSLVGEGPRVFNDGRASAVAQDWAVGGDAVHRAVHMSGPVGGMLLEFSHSQPPHQPPTVCEASSPGLLWCAEYDACCWGGAQCVRRRFLHNIEEITRWPPLQCHHFHSQGEWPGAIHQPALDVGLGAAEYTAPMAFAIAVSASWWAARVGVAKLRVPRMPLAVCVGHRDTWAALDPCALRSQALHPLAVTLGIQPGTSGAFALVPARRSVSEVLRDDGTLPWRHLYIGQGHHSHRLARTVWASPFVAGHNCSFEESLPRYVQYVRKHLWHLLPALAGQVLVVDVVTSFPSEADALAGLFLEALEATGGSGWPSNPYQEVGSSTWTPKALGLATAPLCDPSHVFSGFLRQEVLVQAVRKLFPEEWLAGFVFPCIEDLVNAPPFDLYPRWVRSQGLDWSGPQGPAVGPASARILQRAAGQQEGALNQRAALPPLLSFGLSDDEHFSQAVARLCAPLPTEQPPVLDRDLAFASEFTASHRLSLRNRRKQSLGALKELKRRCAVLDTHLRKFQAPPLRRVTAARDIGLVAILVVLLMWPDYALPFALLAGMPAVGFAPCYGIFPQLEVDKIEYEEVLGDWRAHNAKVLQSIGPSRDDDFLLSQSTKDFESGFCTPPLSKESLLRRLKGRPYRLIPRCVITQSSGKQRIIDNADAGGQSESSRDSNKLVLCSALRPGQHAQAILSRVDPADWVQIRESDSLESGGEDWPDAYRHCPMAESEALACLVVWWHKEWQAPAFQIYSGLLFGLPLAVTSFNRYSRFSEAVSRRIALTVVSSYFDDFNLVDWASSKGSGQWAVGEVNRALGTPFAEEKRQPMRPHGCFLGLDHDLSEAVRQGCVKFWAREKLFTKLDDFIQQALSSGSLKSGQASKMFGLINFLEQGMYGRVGRGGLAALAERQRSPEAHITEELRECFHLIRTVLSMKPMRQFWVSDPPVQRFVAASDAAEEARGQGTGGFLLVWQHRFGQLREAFVAANPEKLYQLWVPGDKKIAQLELSMVLFALVARPQEFRHRRGVWYLDNTAALMALIRGRSDNPDLARMSQLIHLCLFVYQCWVYWEWVPSKSNWSDAISREGVSDPWHQANKFSTFEAHFPFELWELPLGAAACVFECL